MSSTGPAPEHSAERLLRIAGAVVAPTTLLTGLLFYFGFMHAFWFFDYFGVHATVLGLSTEDYLMRSADNLFFPVLVGGLIALGVLAAARLGCGRLLPVRWVVVAGGVLVLIGVLTILGVSWFSFYPGVAPLGLAAGVLLLGYAARIHRVAEWVGAFLLVGVSLFWAVTDYSSAAGLAAAHAVQRSLPSFPDAVLYSEKGLGIRGPGVSEIPELPNGAYAVHYEGLKLVLQSGDYYFFLPAGWTPYAGAAIILPRDDTVRLEFSRQLPGRVAAAPGEAAATGPTG